MYVGSKKYQINKLKNVNLLVYTCTSVVDCFVCQLTYLKVGDKVTLNMILKI